ncbi:hypothetical protein [Gloeobacter kilaueensis]|uniref:Uncharacterized protein n=1 Tax=Gloeobacter kilaueensis (strain ATCC BAA-2537 / CCAP 1431/1 / ULC 316 / JS1) TaxID=1183438 RepID=U5QMD2_GLOK1|nr:hypothetical protein [Gloeobacter kilaueensis]AGY58769.1 hypothetical protein GKIL_2523 [Gloeobacter kilaueensis JS1]
MQWLLLLPLLAQTPEPPVETQPASVPSLTPAPNPIPQPEAPTEATLKIGGYTILSLRGADSTARVEQALQRFNDIVHDAPQPQLTVAVRGNDGGAVLLVNGRGLIDFTPRDTIPNGTSRVLPIARVWAGRLKAVLSNPTVIKSLFVFTGLPERFSYNGADFARGAAPATDVGRFTTDGSRTAPDSTGKSYVLFWDSQLPLPQNTLFLLNRYREFVPYTHL